MKVTSLVLFTLLTASSTGFADDASLIGTAEKNFNLRLEKFEAEWSDADDIAKTNWRLMSDHFVFGMPRLTDDRHNFVPEGTTVVQPGISMIVREGFVIAHFDRMKGPLWVAQRWTKYDADRQNEVPSQDRPWREDLDLPAYARGGTSYAGSKTKLDRGHLAQHATNRAWGIDVSNWGVKMSNSIPQHVDINRNNSSWRTLEDILIEIVEKPDSEIEAIWTYSGAIFRDKTNHVDESAEDDFSDVVRLTEGDFGVPDATYKVVAWFDDEGKFDARAYVFEQPHNSNIVDGQQRPNFNLGNTKLPVVEYLVSIDEVEERSGVDFFPLLANAQEIAIESKVPDSVW